MDALIYKDISHRSSTNAHPYNNELIHLFILTYMTRHTHMFIHYTLTYMTRHTHMFIHYILTHMTRHTHMFIHYISVYICTNRYIYNSHIPSIHHKDIYEEGSNKINNNILQIHVIKILVENPECSDHIAVFEMYFGFVLCVPQKLMLILPIHCDIESPIVRSFVIQHPISAILKSVSEEGKRSSNPRIFPYT